MKNSRIILTLGLAALLAGTGLTLKADQATTVPSGTVSAPATPAAKVHAAKHTAKARKHRKVRRHVRKMKEATPVTSGTTQNDKK
jgi:hypothetical protein